MVRLLEANEIECRIGTINEKGLSLLLYKDARVDQKILDETYTPLGWQRTHQVLDGKLFCTVQVWDNEKKLWIAKQDVGTESYTEKEKGQASDSFKRACVNWGIGRELYSAPFIWIPATKTEISCDGKRYLTHDRFNVSEIAYDENREINYLVITNAKGLPIFRVGNSRLSDMSAKKKSTAEAVKSQLSEKMRTDLQKELDRTGIPLEVVLERYQIKEINEMRPEQYRDALTGLRKSKPVAA